MKKRVAYFNIDGILIGGETTDFDISFDVPYAGNSIVPMDSTFSIDNLSQDTINYLATNTTLFLDRKRHIQFWAGYKGNVKKLFDGEISNAFPMGQPDTSVIIKAWTSTETMGTNEAIEYKNIKYVQLIEDSAKKCGLKCNIAKNIRTSSRLQTIVPEFSHTGSQYEYLRRVMSDVTGFNVVKDQILFCVANGVLTVSKADNINTLLPIKEINMSTGLVGKPEPTSAGVNLRVLFDVTLTAGQTIRLNSKIMPLYNGLYNIYGVTHHGSLRDDDFYTDLVCLRVFEQGEYGVML